MIIDTHVHYNLEPLVQDAQTYYTAAQKAGVRGAICVGTNNQTSQKALELAQTFSNLYASIGIHPCEYIDAIKLLCKQYQDEPEKRQKLVAAHIDQALNIFTDLVIHAQKNKDSKLVAIGEIGLDYYKLKSKGSTRDTIIAAQKQLFSHQLEVAFAQQLPVILHVRDQKTRENENAYFDTFAVVNLLIERFKLEQKTIPAIILHCASGPESYIRNFLEIGAYIGIAGNVTYENAPELKELLEYTPKERLLLETDAPYLAPLEHKGQVCRPELIAVTASFLQDTYKLDLAILLENTLRVFPQLHKVLE